MATGGPDDVTVCGLGKQASIPKSKTDVHCICACGVINDSRIHEAFPPDLLELWRRYGAQVLPHQFP